MHKIVYSTHIIADAIWFCLYVFFYLAFLFFTFLINVLSRSATFKKNSELSQKLNCHKINFTYHWCTRAIYLLLLFFVLFWFCLFFSENNRLKIFKKEFSEPHFILSSCLNQSVYMVLGILLKISNKNKINHILFEFSGYVVVDSFAFIHSHQIAKLNIWVFLEIWNLDLSQKIFP